MTLLEERDDQSTGRPVDSKQSTGLVGVMLLSGRDTAIEDGAADSASDALTSAALARVSSLLSGRDTATKDGQGRLVVGIYDGPRRHQIRRLNAMTREIVREPLVGEEVGRM